MHGGASPQVKAKALQRVEASKTRVLEEMCHLSFADIREAFDAHGNLLPIKELPDRIAKAIVGIDYDDLWEMNKEGKRVKVGRTAKIRLADKKGMIDSMAKHLGMFTEKVELAGEGGGAIKVIVRSVLDKKE